jgi:hypothetical protein
LDENGEPLLDGNQLPLLIEKGKKGKTTVFRVIDGMVKPFMDKDQNLIVGTTPTLYEYIRREQPFANRWSPWDVLKDPGSVMQDHSDAEWVAFRNHPKVEEVQNHPFYENNKKVEPTHLPDYIRDIREQKDAKTFEVDPDRVELFEIYYKEYDKDIRGYRMHLRVQATGHDEALFDDISPYNIEGFPLETVSFLGDPERAQSLSMIDVLRPQIDSVNVSLTQLANFRERFSQKYIYDKNRTTEREAQRFASGRIASVIGVRMPAGEDVRTAFRPVETPPLDQTLLVQLDQDWNNVQKLSGLTDVQLGGPGIARQATQVNAIEGALGVRLQEMADRLADGILGVLRKEKQLLQQFGDYPVALKITQKGEEVWHQFTAADDIPDDLDFTFDIHTAAFQSRAAEKTETLELLNIVGNLGHNLTPIFERLYKAYGYPDVGSIIGQPQPVPGEEPVQSLSANAIDSNRANRTLNPGSNPVSDSNI